jgi:hypothetical protein
MASAGVSRKRTSELEVTHSLVSPFFGAAVERFCCELAPAHCKTVVNSVKEIARMRQNIVVNMLAIGESLSKLRSVLGVDKFSRFMRTVLPALGISRSTGYRWLGLAEKLVLIFPNPVIRKHLMALTDGKGIVTALSRDGKRDACNVVLTPAATAALKRLPAPPTRADDHTGCEEWVNRFIKATGEARACVRVAGRGRFEAEQAILRRFERFAARYGSQAAEDLCGLLDKALNKIVEMNSFHRPGRLEVMKVALPQGELAVR